MFAELLLKLSFILPTPMAVEQPVNLSRNIYWMEQASPEESPEQALERFAQDRQGPAVRSLNLGFTSKTYWFVTRLQNPTDIDEIVLSSTFPGIDHLQLWSITEAGWKTHAMQGDHYPASHRAFDSRTANVKIELPKGQEVIVLYKIWGNCPTQAGFIASTVGTFTRTQNTENTLLWLCFGVAGVMFAYQMFLWKSTRNQLDLLYAVFIFYSTLVNMLVQGHVFQYFLPDALAAHSDGLIVAPIGPVLFLVMMEFSLNFLALKRFSPRSYKVLRGMQVAILGILVLAFVPPFRIFNQLFQLSGLIFPIATLTVAIIAQRNGQKAARFFIIAFLSYLVTVVLFLASNVGILPSNAFFTAAPVVGSALQITLLALAMGDRMNILKTIAKEAEDKRREDEAKHKAEVQAWNESLERRIEDQTRDIRSLLENTKVGLMSVTQDLAVHKDYARYLESIFEEAGLANRPFTELLLEKMDLNVDDREKILTAMEYTIGEDECMFEANASVFPREVKVTIAGKTKILDFDWSPMINKDGNVERILVSLRDMTENQKLREQAAEGARNLKLLGELLEIGPVRFQKFDKAAEDTWKSIEKILSETKDQLAFECLRKIYVGLHTMKGVARMYKLSELTSRIHLAEEIVAQKKSLESDAIVALSEHMKAIQEAHLAYKEAIKPLYKIQGQLDLLDAEGNPHELRNILNEMTETADMLARELGKSGCKVQVEVPQDFVLDEAFAKALQDSLVHLIRNSVDHGLEATSEREAKGKPTLGTIRMYVDGKGNLCIEDDGRGLDLRRIANKAETLGKTVRDTTELANLIFDSGFSTKDSANEISGRGIGMDAVREFMRGVGSNIHIVPKGTEGDFLKFYFEIALPSSHKFAG